MKYDIAGGLSNLHKHVIFYYPIPVSFKEDQPLLLDLKEGWYVYPMNEKYLIIEVKDV